MKTTKPSTKLAREPVLQHKLPFIVPAPLLFYRDLFEKLIGSLGSLAKEAATRIFVPPHPPDAVKYGIREKTITTIFGVKFRLKVQRYKLPNGRTTSLDMLTLPQGTYDINIVLLAVTFYANGVPSHMIAVILQGYFCVDVSVGTILNWVKVIGELGYLEHRRLVQEKHVSGRYSPRQVGMDEIYFTMTADDKPLGISYLVDLESSAIIDVYAFRGRNISRIDVSRIYQRNKRYMDSIEIVTTDGAKPYVYFVELLNNDVIHIVCLQHKTRNIRKTAAVRKLIREKILEEAVYHMECISNELQEHKKWFQEALNYILPPGVPKKIREPIIRTGTMVFLDKESELLDVYQQRLREHLNAYEAYVHHRLYVSAHAALVGKLRLLYKEMRKGGDSGALKWANRVVYTTAMIEGMNRPLRNRIRRAIRYRDEELATAVAKLYLLQHNTLSRTRERVTTPYEKIGIPIYEMFWNPFVRLYFPIQDAERDAERVVSGSASQLSRYRVRRRIFGKWYSKRVELKRVVNSAIGRKYVEGAIYAVVKVREEVLSS